MMGLDIQVFAIVHSERVVLLERGVFPVVIVVLLNQTNPQTQPDASLRMAVLPRQR